MQTISVQQLHSLLKKHLPKDSIVIDVRTPGEYNSQHIQGVINYPLSAIKNFAPKLRKYNHVYIHCNTDRRSADAGEILLNLGLDNSIIILGGFQAWKQEQYPIIKGKGSISIMRQVRITAGSLVIIGALLAVYSNPQFIWLSAFVGAGLLFAGLSGTCAMASFFAHMPWNK